MQIKTATIIGSTGLTGTALLQLLLQDESIPNTRLLVRKPLPEISDRVEIKVIDFDNAGEFKNGLTGSDVVFCATGTTQKKVKGDKQLYRKVDYDIPVNAAVYCKEVGCSKMVIVSAIGANSNSANFYLRLKGETENVLRTSGVQTIHIMQPSMLLGNRKEKRPLEALMQRVIRGLSFLFVGKLQRYRGIEAADVARAMITVAKDDTPGFFLHQYRDMMALSKKIS